MAPNIPDLIIDTLLYTLEHAFKHLSIYPVESFTKVVFYGIQVNHNRHPEVQEYLDGLRTELGKLVKRQRLGRVWFDFKMEDDTVVSIGISFGEFFLNDGRGIGWKVIGAPSKKDSWITVVAGLKTWFLSLLTVVDQVQGKASDFDIRISSVPDDELIFDEHWGLDSYLDPNKLLHDQKTVLTLQQIPDMNADLGDDGNLKLHSYIVRRVS